MTLLERIAARNPQPATGHVAAWVRRAQENRLPVRDNTGRIYTESSVIDAADRAAARREVVRMVAER
jgi:hypothetical protein